MKAENFTTPFALDQSREEIFDVVKKVRGWSHEIDGITGTLVVDYKFDYQGNLGTNTPKTRKRNS